MLFNSTQFFVFFPIVTLLYFVLPDRMKNIWLLIASYYFYMCWNPIFILLILYATIVTYVAAIGVRYTTGGVRKGILITGVILDLAILFWFKYFEFFVSSINVVLEKIGLQILPNSFDIILPVGISFFSFQTVSYLVDVYRGDVELEKNLGRYALFVAFFPQLVAGPIERSKDFLNQFKEKHVFNYQNARNGFLLMIWGFFLKLVIADRVAIYVDTVYGNIETYSGAYICVAAIFFAFQVYCDFAGYSTIAIGAATVMGFHLTDNFNAPFYSVSVADMWRRWHVSLAEWFKDYVYFPLGGSRKGILRKYINLFVVNLVSGLWHGANWTYVMWGFWNGVFRIVGDLTSKMRKRIREALHIKDEWIIYKGMAMLTTFILFVFTTVYFRASNVKLAHQAFTSMLTANNWEILWNGQLFVAGLSRANFVVALVAVAVLMVADSYKYRGVVIREKILSFPMPLRWGIYLFGIFCIIIFGMYGNGNSSFIYFAF